jgi:hypothetical protein
MYVALDWPWESLKSDSRTLGVLGLIYANDGNMNQRFSDIADFEPGGVEGGTTECTATIFQTSP